MRFTCIRVHLAISVTLLSFVHVTFGISGSVTVLHELSGVLQNIETHRTASINTLQAKRSKHTMENQHQNDDGYLKV